jgi:hypothetical protein
MQAEFLEALDVLVLLREMRSFSIFGKIGASEKRL